MDRLGEPVHNPHMKASDFFSDEEDLAAEDEGERKRPSSTKRKIFTALPEADEVIEEDEDEEEEDGKDNAEAAAYGYADIAGDY